MMRKASCVVRSNTFTAEYSLALPAVCSTPGTTPWYSKGGLPPPRCPTQICASWGPQGVLHLHP
eukprot:4506875-Heterocapsa_arctica.AAC.1